jgi:hypothetical protein
MKRVVKLYLEKPELAGVVLLIVLMSFFEVRSNGVFLSFQNIRGVLGLLPEDRQHQSNEHAGEIAGQRQIARLEIPDPAPCHTQPTLRRGDQAVTASLVIALPPSAG